MYSEEGKADAGKGPSTKGLQDEKGGPVYGAAVKQNPWARPVPHAGVGGSTAKEDP